MIGTGVCQSCEHVTEIKSYKPMSDSVHIEEIWLCNICSSTFIGNAVQFPTEYQDVNLYRTIGKIANIILDEVRKTR